MVITLLQTGLTLTGDSWCLIEHKQFHRTPATDKVLWGWWLKTKPRPLVIMSQAEWPNILLRHRPPTPPDTVTAASSPLTRVSLALADLLFREDYQDPKPVMTPIPDSIQSREKPHFPKLSSKSLHTSPNPMISLLWHPLTETPGFPMACIPSLQWVIKPPCLTTTGVLLVVLGWRHGQKITDSCPLTKCGLGSWSL